MGKTSQLNLCFRCMCYDGVGNRIFGEALSKDAANMTCGKLFISMWRHQHQRRKTNLSIFDRSQCRRTPPFIPLL